MFYLWLLILIIKSASAVIYHLDDAYYERMPPLFGLDDYDTCLSEENGLYCVVQLTLSAEPSNWLMQMIQEYSAQTFKHYNHSIIDRGVCVTKTCKKYLRTRETTADLKNHLETCLRESLYNEYEIVPTVTAVHSCEKRNELTEIDVWDKTVLALLLVIATVNCVGSFCDYFGKGPTLMHEFSLKRNWNNLINTQVRDDKTVNLKFAHGFRVIASLCTIILHVIFIFTSGFIINPHDIEKTFEKKSYILMYNGLMFIQIFFFMSGFLKGFDFRTEGEKRNITLRNFPVIMLLRFSRFVPVLAVCLALASSWVRHAGSGPLWKIFITNSLTADCRNYWWRHLLFINNFNPNDKYCFIQTWHLAAEMQVFSAGVCVWLVSRRLLPALLVLAALLPAVHTLLQDLEAVIITPQFFRTFESATFWKQHVLGHNNITCFVMGMLVADKIYDMQKNGRLTVHWWWRFSQYASVAAIVLLLLSGESFYADGQQYGLITKAAYTAGVRVAFGLVCANAAFAYCSNTDTYIKSFVKRRWWTVLARLSYCVFLVHMAVIHMLMGTKTTLTHYSFNNVLFMYGVVVTLSFVISIPLYVMVEAPFTILFKRLLKPSRRLMKNERKTKIR